jgi:hypothetical protein
MAAAVTTGVVALMLDANHQAGYHSAPALTANTVKAILQYTAIPLHDDQGHVYDALTQGTGEINAPGAVALANAIDPSARRESRWLRNSVPSQTNIGGQLYTWSQNIIWGDNIVWGDLLFHHMGAWTLNIVWGDNIVWSDNIVWGDVANIKTTNIVWGAVVDWSDNIVWGNSLIGMSEGDNIVWGNAAGEDNIVWGNLTGDNIVWGNLFDDNIVWGNSASDDNIIWGSSLFIDLQSGVF